MQKAKAMPNSAQMSRIVPARPTSILICNLHEVKLSDKESNHDRHSTQLTFVKYPSSYSQRRELS